MARHHLVQYSRGIAMGAADLVPGVSGGTVALVAGIYHRLIDNVRTGSLALVAMVRLDVAAGRRHLAALEWGFLLPLAAGIVTAIIVLSHSLESLLEEQPVPMAGLFFGLVVGSIVLASRLVSAWDGRHLVIGAAAAAVTFAVLGLQQGSVEDPALWFVFGAGAIAICAMILPGISGSFLLLMMGMYDLVLAAVTDVDLVFLVTFSLGCVVGLAVFSQVLHWGLEHHEQTVLAGLVGLMVGSLRVLWPWPDGVAGNELTGPQGDVLAPMALAAVGFGAVLWFSAFATRHAAAEPSGAETST